MRASDAECDLFDVEESDSGDSIEDSDSGDSIGEIMAHTLDIHFDDDQEEEEGEEVEEWEPQVEEADSDQDSPPEEEAEYGDVLFEPPLYIQRYLYVLDVFEAIQKQTRTIKIVADLGCSECKFIKYFRQQAGVEKVYGVDVDKETMENNSKFLKPLVADYLGDRDHPFEIELLKGSVADMDARLSRVDAVSAIELIEHLHPHELQAFPKTVFGFMEPKVAVITTPNREHNKLLPNFTGPFRHWDHKFEWTREEFETWCKGIVGDYPEYEVRFSGVGFPGDSPPPEGYCSQIAVFERMPGHEYRGLEGKEVYQRISHHVFPYTVDNRSFEQKVFDEASYYIRSIAMNKRMHDEELNDEKVIPIEISSLMDFTNIKKLTNDAELIASVLKKEGKVVEDGKVLFEVPEEPEGEVDELIGWDHCDLFGTHDYDYEVGDVYDCPCFSSGGVFCSSDADNSRSDSEFAINNVDHEEVWE